MIDQTTADALNKALDLAKQGVVAAFETVKQYAPVVWGMARRQIMLEGVELIVGWTLLTALYAFLFRTAYCSHRDGGEMAGEPYGIFKVVAALVYSIATAALVVNAVDLLFNPDYWTMMKILELTRGH